MHCERDGLREKTESPPAVWREGTDARARQKRRRFGVWKRKEVR
nr:MAG TPA: hypothetical protein [Caudoviricetes sp.]